MKINEIAAFSPIEHNQIPDFDILRAMIMGELCAPAYIVRDYISHNICNIIKRKFFELISETDGGNRQNDFVPVIQIGATQFNKSSSDYIFEVSRTKAQIDEILRSVEIDHHQVDLFLDRFLTTNFENIGIKFRPSRFDGTEVNNFTIRKWTNSGMDSFALLPHEDLSQLSFARADGFEISDVSKVIACNICVSNSGGGDLLIWNLDPSLELKMKLGVEDTGYPYPLGILKSIKCCRIRINPGDIYFINANLIHAVEEINSSSRITLGRFVGNYGDQVMYWT